MNQQSWKEGFERRHGLGSYETVVSLYENKTPYSVVGSRFGASREASRQWHDILFPEEAGRGHERRHKFVVDKRLHELLEDEVFKLFYAYACKTLGKSSIEFIQKDGSFRKRAVMLKGEKVLLRKAIHKARDTKTVKAYYLYNQNEEAPYVFYYIDRRNFLFMPKLEHDTSFIDTESSMYNRYKNNFDCFEE